MIRDMAVALREHDGSQEHVLRIYLASSLTEANEGGFSQDPLPPQLIANAGWYYYRLHYWL